MTNIVTFAKYVQYVFFFYKCIKYLPLFVCRQYKLTLQVQSKHIKILKNKKTKKQKQAKTKLVKLKKEKEKKGMLTKSKIQFMSL